MPISNLFIKLFLKKISLLELYTNDDIDKMKYSLQVILGELEKLIILGFIFWQIGSLNYFIINIIVLLSIRIYAGGHHCNTSLGCLLFTFSVIFMAIYILPLITLNIIGIYFIATGSLLINIVLAPITNISRPLANNKKNTSKCISSLITFIFLTIIIHNLNNVYAISTLWIIFIQNIQLLLEYFRRRFLQNEKTCKASKLFN